MVVCLYAALAHNILVCSSQLALCCGGGGADRFPRALAHMRNACLVTCTVVVVVAVLYIYMMV